MVNAEDILKQMKAVSLKKPTVYDGILPKAIKTCSAELVPSFTHIMNKLYAYQIYDKLTPNL